MTKEIFHRYFNGQCTAAEIEQVTAYLQGDDLSLLHEYMDGVDASITDNQKIKAEESEKLLNQIHDSLQTQELLKYIEHAHEDRSNPVNNPLPSTAAIRTDRSPLHLPVWHIAASLLLFLTLGTGAYWLISNSGKPVGKSHDLSWSVSSNNSNKIKLVTMPDGTSIWLERKSSISYQKGAYNTAKREIYMKGQAFFDVAHNLEKPFIVHAGKITTTVLGTAFNIEAYKNENSVRVILVRGKVNVKAPNRNQILRPGQMLSYNIEKDNLDIREVATKNVNAWISGKIVFNNIPLSDALNRLQDHYNIKISYPEAALKNKRLSGMFESARPDEVLNKILFVHGMKYMKKGGAYIIQP